MNDKRFSCDKLYKKSIIKFLEEPETSGSLNSIKSDLANERVYKYLISSLIRNVFLIELVKDEVDSTKMAVRWIKKEAGGKKEEPFDESDPRYCSFDDCINVFNILLNDLANSIDEENINFIKSFEKNNLLPYEIPLDYSNRNGGQIHKAGNIKWFWDERYKKILQLRSFLLSHNNPFQQILADILNDKIKVKVYLTDRVQTGVHKTNREKRWEVHPESVHFAQRITCLEIEHMLLNQLFNFRDFPEILIRDLESKQLITPSRNIFCCPVTLDELSFKDLELEIKSPIHGKSKFQIGHLRPLKSGIGEHISGHTQENISWVSDEGNRIQGNLTIDETRALLKRIQRNYSTHSL